MHDATKTGVSRNGVARVSPQAEAEAEAPQQPVGRVSGTEGREIAALGAVQRMFGQPASVGAARGLSLWGEHAAGWLAIAAVGAAVDRGRRADWLVAGAGVAFAHGLSIGVKRLVRRPRPTDDTLRTLVKTPSALSFPSSHASSTTAAAMLYGGLTGRRLAPVLVPPMLLSRLVLGVHYPTDVLAGTALGAVVSVGVRRLSRSLRRRSGR